jgi:LysM domain
MSAATQQVPIVVLPAHFLPGRAGHPSRPRGLRAVPDRTARQVAPPRCRAGPDRPRQLVPPLPLAGETPQTPTRLTRRGVLALATLTAAAAGTLTWVAWLSAPAAPAPASPPPRVTVRSGDTLWSIATAVAPNRDPRDEVATLQRLNHLDGVSLSVGEVLRTR